MGTGLLMGFLALPFSPVQAQSIPVDAALREVPTSAVVQRRDAGTTIAPYRDAGLSTSSLAAHAAPATVPPPFAFDPATMMPVGEIRPGMTGYGLSVFSGLEPERFEAEVVGVRHRMMAGTDIILCRLKSPHLVNLGVIAGMSGSPVYMDDRLIGAVAYGFTDVDEPLAGVTPIADMLKVYNATPQQPALDAEEAGQADTDGLALFNSYMAFRDNPSVEALASLAAPHQPLASMTFNSDELGDGVARRFGLPPSLSLEPLSTPVFVGGNDTITARLAARVFPGLNMIRPQQEMQALTAGGVPSAASVNSPGGPIADLGAFAQKLSGGYALAVPFIEGDFNMAGVGTVTWRHGDRLIAFGHPMMQGGTVYFPMAAARINALVRSRVKPFKLGEPVGHIGMVRQDRLPAVGGLFGQTARMFDVSVSLDDPAYAGKRAFNYRIFNNRQMSPGLLMTALGESIGAGARTGGESAALYHYSIGLDDGTTITASDYKSDSNASLTAIFGAMSDTGALMNNPFQSVNVTSVTFEMQVIDRLREATIEAAAMDKTTYQPGESAVIEWVLRPYRAEPVRLSYTFSVPGDLPDGEYDLVVMDAAQRQDVEKKRNPGAVKVRDYRDLVRRLQENYPANRIYIALVDQDTGVSVVGNEMPRLPASVINLIEGTVDSEYFSPVRGNYVIDADMVTNYEVTGQSKTKLTVERR